MKFLTCVAALAVCMLLIAVSNVVSAVVRERRYREESAMKCVVKIFSEGQKDE